MIKVKTALFFLILAILAGFFAGRATINTKEVVRKVEGERVSGHISGLELRAKEIVPTDPILPMRYVYRKDTVFVQVDTAKIIEDYITERRYDITLFDNTTIGKLDLKPTLQYNKLSQLDYTFTPIHTEITRYRERLFTPFASLSYNTLNYVGAGGGVFIRDLGVEYTYHYSLGVPVNSYHELGVKWKF